jgi:hypothetical protein
MLHKGHLINGMLIHLNNQIPYQEHVFIHHSFYSKIYADVPAHMSMYLHSYALHLFSSKYISVFPLAVMYNIFIHSLQPDEIEIHQQPIFNEIPKGFIYQPLLTIPATEKFLSLWHL